MKKRICVLLMAALLAVTGVFTFGGCAAKEELTGDSKTLNVKIKSSGYGTDFIHALKEQFETTFAEEGYKINVLAPDTALSETKILQTVYTQKGDSGVDIFFSSLNARNGVEGNYGQCIADLTENVWKKTPIKFDKSTEDKTVEEKVAGMDFQGASEYNGKYYGVPYALAFGGLAVNKKVLETFKDADGKTLELPKTSNELFECARVIMSKATKPTDVKPFTYSTSGNNYAISTVNPWLAQYEGYDRFNQFWSFEDENGPMVDGEDATRCAEVFAFEGVEKTFEALFEMYDYNVAAQGANSQTFNQAQGQLMNGDAVFYSVGSWMLNEEYVRWKDNINDVVFIRTPVLSALGTKMFGEGTDYAMSDADCEKALRMIIDGADEDKAPEDIKPTIDAAFGKDFKTDDILRVCEARGYAKNSSGNGAYLNEKSNKKELAYTFLRFIASEDAGKLIASNTRTPSPFAKECLKDSEIEYLRNLDEIANSRYFKMITADSSGYRKEMGVNSMFMSYAGEYFANKVRDWRVSIYKDDVYTFKDTVSVANGDTKHSAKIADITINGKYSREPYTICAEAFANEIYKVAIENLKSGLWKVQ
ncbi:MAG: extracellular solute-binding protein [Clostridiales bacterium]|nr:extracellular solute-binding protein [Clostridiales bacterium]